MILFGDRFLNIEDFTNIISLKIGFFWFFFWNTKVALTNKPHLTTFAKPLAPPSQAPMAQDQYQNAILELVLKMGTQVWQVGYVSVNKNEPIDYKWVVK